MIKNLLARLSYQLVALIYGVLSFLFAPLVFLISGFFISAFIFFILNLVAYIIFPSFFWIPYLFIGVIASSWGVGILKGQSEGKIKKIEDEVSIGLESINQTIILGLFSAFVGCYLFAILELLKIGSDNFRIILLISSFLITFFLFLIRLSKIEKQEIE